jgi:hypothetical protein
MHRKNQIKLGSVLVTGVREWHAEVEGATRKKRDSGIENKNFQMTYAWMGYLND